jgi:hypothetical protein
MVVLRDGDIRVVKNGTTLAEPFLSIPDVDSKGGTGFESGLLSMAFSPDYLTSGRFYVFLTSDDANPGDPPHAPIEIREYRRSAADPEVADPATERDVLQIAHPNNANHYGGTLRFGPDGLLYASVGDGGGGGDPFNNAQNPNTKLGKLLRLDPRRLGSAPYRIPPANPFANGGGDPLVYSLGLRNPFRFSFDRQNGDLTIGDVGQGSYEEVDFAPSPGRGRGTDFGWNHCEGLRNYPGGTQPCNTDTLPVYAYDHSSGCSVTGGVVVRDPSLPTLAGKYVFSDFCNTFVRRLDLALPAATNPTDLPVTANNVTAFGEDACGRVHLVQLGASGTVRRLEDDAAPGTCDLQVTYLPPVPDPVETAPPPPGQARPAVPVLAFFLGGSLRQRPLRSRNVGVRVRCDRACSVRAIGRLSLKLKGKRIRLRDAVGRLGAAGTLSLRLRVPAKARRPLRRALLSRRSVRTALTIRVRDAGGKLSLRQRTVRLRR